MQISSDPGKGTLVSVELPRVQENGTRTGLVLLLDDDMLVHMNWKLAAKAAGAEFKAYKTPEELRAATDGLQRDTLIFIDSDLGDGIKGENIAKELHDRGFTDIAMATGHRHDKFSHLPWLKVHGKEPPWETK